MYEVRGYRWLERGCACCSGGVVVVWWWEVKAGVEGQWRLLGVGTGAVRRCRPWGVGAIGAAENDKQKSSAVVCVHVG